MGFFSGVKKVVKPLVDVPRWMGLDQFKAMNRWLGGVIKGLFIPEKAETEETFEQAMERLKLTEDDLKNRLHEFGRLLVIWMVLFFLIFLYAVYLAWVGSWFGFLAGVAVSILALSQAFRYHFWIFQIKQRKLGCTFKEWWAVNVRGESQ